MGVNISISVLCVLCVLQEKDLKQYMDDCGNIMSMTNVKVSMDTFLLIHEVIKSYKLCHLNNEETGLW